MPLRTAARLLPSDAVFLRGSYRLYGEYSEKVMTILRDFTPDIEQVSVDEAYMDVTGCLHFWGHDPRRMAEAMKERIRRECGLSVSIGVAANRVCAKIAAGVNKPDGLVVVPPGTEREFLDPLPVEAVPGIGPRTLPHLHTYGIRTVGDAVAYAERNAPAAGGWPPLRAGRLRTFSLCRFLASCAVPSDEAILAHDHVEKSISRDMTFGTDTADGERVTATLYCLAECCCKTLRQDELTASTVTVRVRFADFTTVQKQAALPLPSSNEEDIFGAARRLLALLCVPGQLVRLVGVKVSGLSAAEGAQLDLGVTAVEKFSALHRRLDGLQSRYGYGSIRWGITCGVAERREERE
jgi:DNA polymerase-4